ncbi:MAG: hypothetical protein HKP08_03540 [Flavobacteriaceae bacterium]|nr:hypothetical protein [Flavobacteriaceae bacterium]
MKRLIIIFPFILGACLGVDDSKRQWTFESSLQLDGVNPIGITETEGAIWLSDGDHNRLVSLDMAGNITEEIDEMDRPMHLSSEEGILYVPQYGNDEIIKIDKDRVTALLLGDSLDAPAAVDVKGDFIAIADFYNNRILAYNGEEWMSFGKEGKGEGEFYYPTDVQITDESIWVADAYNNRVQVFDRSGNFERMLGQDQKMNAATGIYVHNSQVFVTDFENNRVLIFDLDGNLIQELKEGIDKPTDVLIYDGILFITNYRQGQLVRYQ